MNSEPHVHEVKVRDSGLFVDIQYGDQGKSLWRGDFALSRRPFESDERYAKRRASVIEKNIAQVIRAHDRASQAAPLMQPVIPTFRPDAWGSDQLGEKR